jgi:serine phosphatase RsbU (regulator of sigma subunit)
MFGLLLRILFFVFLAFDVMAALLLAGADPAGLSALASARGLSADRIVAAVLLFEAVFFLAYIRVFHSRPLAALRKQIALFLTGSKAAGQFETDSPNANFAFVNTFIAKSLQILVKFRKEMEEGRVLRTEVEIAADIQKHILAQAQVQIPGIDVVARTKSATEVGGDSFDIIPSGHNSYIYIGDVTGHGVPSGFVMMIVNSLISAFSRTFESGADIISNTNAILKPRIKSNMLMSLLMIRWDDLAKKLSMTGAGHEYLLIYRADSGRVVKIQSGGIALGMTKDISKLAKERDVEFAPGDIAVLYTDGITEARNGRGADAMMFGVDRLVETIETAESKTAQGVFNAITIALSRFMGYNHKQFDDITLIVLQYRDKEKLEIPSDEIRPEFITEWNW